MSYARPLWYFLCPQRQTKTQHLFEILHWLFATCGRSKRQVDESAQSKVPGCSGMSGSASVPVGECRQPRLSVRNPSCGGRQEAGCGCADGSCRCGSVSQQSAAAAAPTGACFRRERDEQLIRQQPRDGGEEVEGGGRELQLMRVMNRPGNHRDLKKTCVNAHLCMSVSLFMCIMFKTHRGGTD